MTNTVVVRVDEELKKKLKAHNVRISDVVRSALMEEVKKRDNDKLVSAIREAKRSLSKVSDKDIIKAVRESRDSR
jgi:post-segregation antitoxin (ccd killing protein)